MAMKDMLQMRRKLKHPYIRRWYHGKGDDTYTQVKATKTKMQMLKGSPKKLKDNYYVAYGGMEYSPDEFFRKHPRRRKKKKKR